MDKRILAHRKKRQMRLGSARRGTTTNPDTPSEGHHSSDSVWCNELQTRRCVSVPLEPGLASRSSTRWNHVCFWHREEIRRESPTKTNDWKFLPRIRGHLITQRRSQKSGTELFKVYQDMNPNHLDAAQPFLTSRSQIEYMEHSILSDQEKKELIAVLDLRPLQQRPSKMIDRKIPAAPSTYRSQKTDSESSCVTREKPTIDPKLKLIQTHTSAAYKFGKDSQELSSYQAHPLESTQPSMTSTTLLKLAPAFSFPPQSSLENLPRFNQKHIPAKTQSNGNLDIGVDLMNEKKDKYTQRHPPNIKMNVQIEASPSANKRLDSTIDELSTDSSSIGDFDLEAELRLDENIFPEARDISMTWGTQRSVHTRQPNVRLAESFELPMRWLDNPTIEIEYFVGRKKAGDLLALLKLQTQLLI